MIMVTGRARSRPRTSSLQKIKIVHFCNIQTRAAGSQSSLTEPTPNAQMQILFVGNSFEYFVSHRLTLAQAAKAQGWSVHVATPPSKRGDSLLSYGIAHHPLAMDR